MLEAFLAKARELGGPALAHARARARAPASSEELSGAVVATTRGLVFVVEELFDAGAATLLPRETLCGVSRRDELWGAELTLDTSQGAWIFSRVEPKAVGPLLSALGLELESRDVRVLEVTEPGSAPAPDDTVDTTSDGMHGKAAFGAHVETHTVETQRVGASALPPRDASSPAALTNSSQTDSAEPPKAPTTLAATPTTEQRTLRVVVFALAVAVVSGVVLGIVSSASSPADVPQSAPVVVALDAEPGLRTGKETYTSSETIAVYFHGFPGNAQDWITVVEKEAPDDTYDEWRYLDRRRGGILSFGPLSPGTYEVRAFFDWPRGGYTVQHRVTVRVVD